jgi:hypothetical protein
MQASCSVELVVEYSIQVSKRKQRRVCKKRSRAERYKQRSSDSSTVLHFKRKFLSNSQYKALHDGQFTYIPEAPCVYNAKEG